MDNAPFFVVDHHPTSKDVVLCASAVRTEPGKFMMRRAFRDAPYQKIFINCPDNSWYLDGVPGLGTSLRSTATSLSDIARGLCGEAGRIVFYGGSMGGYAAAILGSMMNVDFILATGVEFLLNIPGGNSAQFLRGRRSLEDIAGILSSSRSRMVLLYGEEAISDLICALYVSDYLNGNSEIVTLKCKSHALPPYLEKTYGISTLIAEFLASYNITLDAGSVGNILMYPQLVQALYAAERQAATDQREVDPNLSAKLQELAFDECIPENYRAYAFNALSKIALKRDELREAVLFGESSARLNNGSHAVLSQLARSYFRAGRYPEAEASADQSLALQSVELLDSDNTTAGLMARSLMAQGKSLEAATFLCTAIKKRPLQKELWSLYARLLRKHAQFADDLQEGALSLFPS